MTTQGKPRRERTSGRRIAIPELAVVDITRERHGRSELAIGVVLATHGESDVYTVELVKAEGGKELIAAMGRDLHVRHII
jgi:hypothetical protein